MDFFLVAASGSFSPAVVYGLLIIVAFLVAEKVLQLVVFSSCGTWAR